VKVSLEVIVLAPLLKERVCVWLNDMPGVPWKDSPIVRAKSD
jgi:hypothetical protein